MDKISLSNPALETEHLIEMMIVQLGKKSKD